MKYLYTNLSSESKILDTLCNYDGDNEKEKVSKMNSRFSKFLALLGSNSGFRASLKKEENLIRFWLYLRVKVYCMRWRTSAMRCVNKTMEDEKTVDDKLTDMMVKHNDPETYNV